MPRLPMPWSKKRGQRTFGSPSAGIAGEVAFSAAAFLSGVFGVSLVLISQFAPQQVPEQVSAEALSSSLQIFAKKHGIDFLIHGHTHRPNYHVYDSYERIVLGDWSDHGWIVSLTNDKPKLEKFIL